MCISVNLVKSFSTLQQNFGRMKVLICNTCYLALECEGYPSDILSRDNWSREPSDLL